MTQQEILINSKSMNIINEIRQARQQLVTNEQKEQLLENVKQQLTTDDTALIEGAPHFRNQVWRFSKWSCRAPYKCHAAISEWLRSLGFHTRKYYNKGGVEYGMEVWI